MAGVGTLAGAGVGAIVGSQTGDAAAGAALGAGVGALAGAAAGSSLDEAAAANRAAIASQLDAPVAPGAARVEEVVRMHHAGVSPDLIVGYIQTSGVAGPPSTEELIALHQQGVPPDVTRALQLAATAPPMAAAPTDVVGPAEPATVIVEQPYPVFVGSDGGRVAAAVRTRPGWAGACRSVSKLRPSWVRRRR